MPFDLNQFEQAIASFEKRILKSTDEAEKIKCAEHAQELRQSIVDNLLAEIKAPKINEKHGIGSDESKIFERNVKNVCRFK